ncbi:Cyclin-dependent protein kinase inhibitor SMR4 [Glycine max]|nr:Cyclin-dependent protein kinase inhibitor SMR4 [Glycine max]
MKSAEPVWLGRRRSLSATRKSMSSLTNTSSVFTVFLETVQQFSSDIEEGCRTPKRSACRIPAAMVCPPPPKKKSAAYTARQRVPPKNGYFVPPDLELIFRVAPTREAFT